MGDYVLRVVTAEDPETDADPSVTGPVLEAAERLFSEICRNIVRGELRLQGEVPEALVSRVRLDGNGALAHDARRFMDETLDYLGGPARGTWMSDTYPDVLGRKRIAGIVLDLASRLSGAVLLHGSGEEPSAFSGVDMIRVGEMAGAVTRAYNGGLVGVVVKDPENRGRWVIDNGCTRTPLVLIGGLVSRYDVEDFAAAGPVIAVGTLMRDEEGRLVELRAVENCYSFPGAVFLRAIAEDGDLGLVQPLMAVPGHYARNGTWHLRCDELGLESVADSWDGCVIGLHRMFLDLWRSHRDGTAEDNPRMKAALDAMCPFDG